MRKIKIGFQIICKNIDNLQQKGSKKFLGFLLSFPDWRLKIFIRSLTVPSLHLTILSTYIDSFVWLIIGYHWLPLDTIWDHLVPSRTI